MNQFNNRIAAQRRVLQIVNTREWQKEDLFGLSHKAIERWVLVNRIDSEAPLVQLVRTVSEKLFFLANRSKEQVSDEYKMLSDEIASVARAIETELAKLSTRA